MEYEIKNRATIAAVRRVRKRVAGEAEDGDGISVFCAAYFALASSGWEGGNVGKWHNLVG